MTLQGMGSMSSPIVISDDEDDDEAIVELELADRLLDPHISEDDDFYLNHSTWVPPQQVFIGNGQRVPSPARCEHNGDYDMAPDSHQMNGYNVAHVAGKKRKFDDIPSAADMYSYPVPKKILQEPREVTHTLLKPAPISLAQESKTARKKRRKRERLAAEEAKAKTQGAIENRHSMQHADDRSIANDTVPRPLIPLPAHPYMHPIPPLPVDLPMPAHLPFAFYHNNMFMPHILPPPHLLPPNIPLPMHFPFPTASPSDFPPPEILREPVVEPQPLPSTSKHGAEIPPPPELPPPPLPARELLPEPVVLSHPLPPNPAKKIIGMPLDTNPRSKHGYYDFTKKPSPNPSRTLVMELMPKKFRTFAFVRKWAMSFGLPPRALPRCDVDQKTGKALIEFSSTELAREVWGSSRFSGGDGKEHIRVWWYRESEVEEGEIDEAGESLPAVKKEKKKPKEKLKDKAKAKQAHQQQSLTLSAAAPQPPRVVRNLEARLSMPGPSSFHRDQGSVAHATPQPETELRARGLSLSTTIENSVSQFAQLTSAVLSWPKENEANTEEAMDLDSDDGFEDEQHVDFEGESSPTVLHSRDLDSAHELDSQSRDSSRPGSPELLGMDVQTESGPLAASIDALLAEVSASAAVMTSGIPAAEPSPSTSLLVHAPKPVHPRPHAVANFSTEVWAAAREDSPSTSIVSSTLASESLEFSSSSTTPPHSPTIPEIAPSVASSTHPDLPVPSAAESMPASEPMLTPLPDSELSTATPPPSEPRAMKNAPKGPSFAKRTLLARQKELEARIARSREELAARSAMTRDGAQSTPIESVESESVTFEASSSGSSSSLTPAAPTPMVVPDHLEAEDRLRRLVVASKKSKTQVTMVKESEYLDFTGDPGTSSTPTSDSPTTIQSPSLPSTPSFSAVLSTTRILSHTVTESSLDLDDLAASFIAETIQKVSPPVAPTRSTTLMRTRSSDKVLLAAKQKLLEEHISETKRLLTMLGATCTRAERDNIRKEMKEREQRMKEAMNAFEEGSPQQSIQVTFTWPTTREDLILDISDDEEYED